jgi:prolyl oligopeptidase
MNGVYKAEIPLPGIGTVDQINGSVNDTMAFLSYTTFTSPAVIYRFNLKSFILSVQFKVKLPFDPEDYVTEQVFFTSKDSTRIPMFLVHRKDYKPDGNTPTLVYGYGGFNISKTPEFKTERIPFLEAGGLIALPILRGGGEYGRSWHKAGTLAKKQNVFDDCIAAAEWLITQGYTNPGKLAIQGRSNGGLLTGAVMTQRPDLFKVALPAVGVMDMLRYHKFTIGWAWATDYGTSDDSSGFEYLIQYSPYHNLKEGVTYPATFITTADHDDRVVPAHSFKFAARIQEVQQGNNPVLIRIDTDAGHGAGKPTNKQIDEQTDIFTFLMYNLGMQL